LALSLRTSRLRGEFFASIVHRPGAKYAKKTRIEKSRKIKFSRPDPKSIYNTSMSGRPVSEQIAQQTRLPRPLVLVLEHIDPIALGVALGLVSGAWVFLMTVTLVIRGGEDVGVNLSLLSQYFFDYSVTMPGAFLGLLYGAVAGFIAGYVFARMRNLLVHSYVRYIRRRAEQELLDDLLDRMI